MTDSNLKKLHTQLTNWYHQNKRSLPWRASSDPYRVWISEVMLQQTTVTAVIPFYDRFIKRFPHVQALATASIEDVYTYWAGLGYYSRARNLHKAALQIHSEGFPRTAEQLLELPGFGPYTSRAVASISFSEPVGVLDGNVIRVLSRLQGRKKEWWNQAEKSYLQTLSDQLAQLGDSSSVNQALMELGATVCTPQKTMCLLCPWIKSCQAYAQNTVTEIPLKRPKKEGKILLWTVELQKDEDAATVEMIKNDYAPFLKGQWLFPGSIEVLNKKPKEYDLQHSITQYQIFIQIKKTKKRKTGGSFIPIQQLSQYNPSSVLKKILKEST